MATLAQINETLRDQTSSIEDGTRTTAGLRDRFGEFLDRQKGSGDKREDEIEERRKERKQKVMASRPRSFSQGLTQGLGFGGLNFGGIAQSILGAMGLAAGAIGLGAGKLLKLGPAIAVMSKFGEQAIAGLVDYVDKEIEGIDFSKQAKEDLTKGAQFSLAARFLGFRHPLAIAMAGLVGAYGDETIDLVNKKLKNEDGKYKVPFLDVEIDTQTQGFQMAMAYAAALLAPSLIRVAGKLAYSQLKKVPLGRAASAVGIALAGMFGFKSGSGALPDPDEIKNNKKKVTPPKIKPVIPPSAMNFKSGIKTTTTIPKAANLNSAMSFAAANNNQAPGYKQPPAGKVPFKFPQYDDAIQRLQKSASNMSKAVSKSLIPMAMAYEYAAGLRNDDLNAVPDFLKGTINMGAELTAGSADLLANGVNAGINLAMMGMNQILPENMKIPESYFLNMQNDTSGAVKRAINSGFENFQLPSLNDQGMIDNIGLFPPNVGLAPEGFITAAGTGNSPVSVRGGDVIKHEQTLIQGVGQVLPPSDAFLIKVDKN